MTPDVQLDQDFTDRQIPRVQLILAPYLTTRASIVRDRTEATDLVTLYAKPITIAVRLRRRELDYWRTFPNEFTIRAERPTGALTELEKIRRGFADWLFYGHADDQVIDPWMLINLHNLRHSFRQWPTLCQPPFMRGVSGMKTNRDGTRFLFLNRARLRSYVTIDHSRL